MALTLSPSWPAATGFLMACLEKYPGSYAGDANMLGFAVHRDLSFAESPSVYFPDQLVNTLARNQNYALGLDNFDLRFSKDFYPEMDPMWFGAVLSTVNPLKTSYVTPSAGSADTYKAATATAAVAGQMSATLQPTKGQKLSVTITTVAAAIVVGATVVITGTDLSGAAISETIIGTTYTQVLGTSATFVTKQGFASIDAAAAGPPTKGITWTGLPTDVTLAVKSVIPQTRLWTQGNAALALDTASLIHFDGGYTREYVYGCMAQMVMSGGLTGAVGMDMSGYCNPLNTFSDAQSGSPSTAVSTPTGVGTTGGQPDITVTPGTAAVAFVQPTADQPEMAWQTNVYIDEPGGAFGTTQYGDCESWRWTAATGLSRLNTAVNSRLFSKVKRGKRSHSLDLTVDFATRTEWQRARQATRRWVQISLIGPAITNTVNQTVIIRMPLVYTAMPISSSTDNTQLQLTGSSFLDTTTPGGAFDLQVSVTNTVTGPIGADAYLPNYHA